MRTLATTWSDDRPPQKDTLRKTAMHAASAAASIAALLIGLAGFLPASTLMAAPSGSGAPGIGTDPDRMSAVLAPGQSETQTLTVLNHGGDPLDWSILDQDTDIGDLRRDSAVVLDSSEYFIVSGVADPAGRFAYFGTSTPPGQVVKIDLETGQRVGAITLQDGAGESGERFLFSAVMDPAGQYAYFGTGTYPGKVIKVDLEHFERVDALTLAPGEDVLRAAVIDPAGEFAYFGSDSFPAHIVKIDLRTFERIGSIDLSEDLSYLDAAAVIDPAGQFAYFGVSFGVVVKIDLASFALAGNLDTGVATLLASAIVDPAGQFAYFGTHDAPGRIAKIDLASFTLSGTLTLAPGEDRPAAAVMAADGGFAYFGTRQTSPGRVVKIDLTTFTRAGAITLGDGEDDLRAAVLDPVRGHIYFGTATLPARVVKVSDVSRNCALPDWTDVIAPGGGTIAGGASQTTDVGFDATGLAIGRHEATLCLQSNDPATPRIAVPLTLDVRLSDVSPQTLAFDVVRGDTGTDTLSIVNRGSGDLDWTIAHADPLKGCDLPATTPWLSISPAAGTLPPGGTAKVGAVADTTGLVAGSHAAQLCITSSSGVDTQKQAIPVGLNVLEPLPVFALTPDSLSVTLPSGQSGNADLSIFNGGAGALDWTIVDESIGPRLRDALALGDGTSAPGAAVVDAAGRYGYFGTLASPGQVVKVDLATFERVATITMAAGEDFLRSAVIDPAGEYVYFGTQTTPGRIVKIDLASFQRVGGIVLETGEEAPTTAVIDPAGAFAYFGTLTDPGKVVKIDLANFVRVGAITFDSSQEEYFLKAAVIDPAGAFAYFGTGPLVGKVVKIDLTSFQRVASLTLADDQGLSAALIDAAGKYAYFGTSPPFFGGGRLVKLDLENFVAAGAVQLDQDNYEGSVNAAVIDPGNRFALVGTTLGSATRLVEIDLVDFFRTGPVSLGVAEGGLHSAVIDPAGRYAYFGSPTYPGRNDPGRVLRIEHRLECGLPVWLTASETSGSVPAGGTHAVGVGIDTGDLAIGTHAANLCFASNDPARPLLNAPVGLTVTATDDRLFADGFDSPTP